MLIREGKELTNMLYPSRNHWRFKKNKQFAPFIAWLSSQGNILIRDLFLPTPFVSPVFQKHFRTTQPFSRRIVIRPSVICQCIMCGTLD